MIQIEPLGLRIENLKFKYPSFAFDNWSRFSTRIKPMWFEPRTIVLWSTTWAVATCSDLTSLLSNLFQPRSSTSRWPMPRRSGCRTPSSGTRRKAASTTSSFQTSTSEFSPTGMSSTVLGNKLFPYQACFPIFPYLSQSLPTPTGL